MASSLFNAEFGWSQVNTPPSVEDSTLKEETFNLEFESNSNYIRVALDPESPLGGVRRLYFCCDPFMGIWVASIARLIHLLPIYVMCRVCKIYAHVFDTSNSFGPKISLPAVIACCKCIDILHCT